MKIEKGDYVVAQTRSESGKVSEFLVRASSYGNGVLSGIVEKYSHIPNRKLSVEVAKGDLVLNLGPNPKPGKVYGCDVTNLYRGKKHHEQFGPLYWFYKPKAADLPQKLDRAFTKAYRALDKAGLDFLIDPSTCIWEIMPFSHEKYAGMYMRSKNSEKVPNRFQIRPEIMPATEWEYVVHHEVGHHFHYQYLKNNPKLEASWVRLYQTSIKVASVRREQAQTLLDQLLSGEDSPSNFKTVLSEEEELLYKLIIRHIGQNYNLSVKELDLLFENEYKDDIRAVWPTRGISKKDLAPIVTEYATRNFKELIAESFAFYMVKKKLPAEVTKLLERSIAYVKTQK